MTNFFERYGISVSSLGGGGGRGGEGRGGRPRVKATFKDHGHTSMRETKEPLGVIYICKITQKPNFSLFQNYLQLIMLIVQFCSSMGKVRKFM